MHAGPVCIDRIGRSGASALRRLPEGAFQRRVGLGIGDGPFESEAGVRRAVFAGGLVLFAVARCGDSGESEQRKQSG